MPKYQYKCPKCDETETIECSITDDHDPPVCSCEEDLEVEMKRDYTSEGIAGIHFKGSGFYSTDYANE